LTRSFHWPAKWLSSTSKVCSFGNWDNQDGKEIRKLRRAKTDADGSAWLLDRVNDMPLTAQGVQISHMRQFNR
jgi:hypothetical protein